MATINAVLATTRKDLKLLRKDPAALVMLFILPLVFILVMSFAMAGMLATGSIAIAVVDEDGGAIGKELARSLSAAGGFAVVTEWQGKPLDRATVERLIRERKEQIAVVVPTGLDAALAAGQGQGGTPHDLLLIADPSLLPQVLAPVRAVLAALAQQAAGSARGGGTAAAPLRVRDDIPAGMQVERKPNSVEQSVPGYTLFGLFFIAMQLATNIVDERQLGTYHRLLAAPLPRWALLVGKLLAFVCINLIQVAVLFAIGVLLLPLIGAPHMSIGAHPEGLVLVTLAVAFAANSLGLALSAITRTRGQAAGLGIIIVITSAMLGGVMVPRYVMPDAMQVMGWISPHTWALMAYQDVLMRGAGVLAVLPEVAILLAFAAVFFSFAAWRFRWA